MDHAAVTAKSEEHYSIRNRLRLMHITILVQQLDDAIMQLASLAVLDEGDEIIAGHYYIFLPREGRKEQG